MKLLAFTSGLAVAIVVALSACAGPGASGEPIGSAGPDACCGPVPYSSENMVTGTIDQPVPVTWSTGAGLVTLHQVEWEVVQLGKDVGTRLAFEATFEATSGTVNYGSRSWFENDSVGRDNGAQAELIRDPGRHALPQQATLQAGQKDRGWAGMLISDAPVAPVEMYLVDIESRTMFVRWVIDPPPQPVLDAMTSEAPFTPASGRRLDCPGEVKGESFDAPDDFQAQRSPIEAAQRFAQAGISDAVAPPDAVWTLAETDATGVFVATDGVLMHAVQSPTNGTWLIDEVQMCVR